MSRRGHGDGGLHWDQARGRWIATVTVGYDGRGKRQVRRRSAKTKSEASKLLRDLVRERDAGLVVSGRATVQDALNDFLQFGVVKTDDKTRTNYEGFCRLHIGPALGAKRLTELSVADVERWLLTLTSDLSTRSIKLALDVLRRALDRAMARDLVHRNVAALVREVPEGRAGRPSKSLTLAQSKAILSHLRPDPFYPYFVVSLMTGARTEELRALTWADTFLEVDQSTDPPTPPHINVVRSVRKKGDTKTRKSRRSLALPSHCVVVLREHRSALARARKEAGDRWQENDLVFPSAVGTEWDASNVRKAFRKAIAGAEGINADEWTPRELRHSFVSTLSDHGVPIEEIARLVGHSSTSVTETVYRHQIRPVIQTGASAMDEIFIASDEDDAN